MSLAGLLEAIKNNFDEEELRTLCFNLGIEYEDLPARSRAGKIRELARYCKRHGNLPNLIKALQEARPLTDWEAIVREPDKFSWIGPKSLSPVMMVIIAVVATLFVLLVVVPGLVTEEPAPTSTHSETSLEEQTDIPLETELTQPPENAESVSSDTPGESPPEPSVPTQVISTKTELGSDGEERLTFSSNGDIFVVNADGSGEFILTNNSANNFLPSWSPDGKQIVFWTDVDGNDEIYRIKIDGTGLTNLTNNSADDRYPVWSPDGELIAFWSSRESGGAYIMNADGTGQSRVSTLMRNGSRPAWSYDSSWIAFASVYAKGLIRIASVEGLGEYSLLEGEVNYELGAGPYFAWSPTGPWIAALLNTDGKDDLFMVNINTQDSVRLTDDSTTEGTITWSPDGRYVAYAKKGNVYMVSADGSASPVNLTNNSVDSASYRTLTWSPDGSQLATTDSMGNGIFLINVDGSGQTRLTSLHWDQFYDYGPQWQPSGN